MSKPLPPRTPNTTPTSANTPKTPTYSPQSTPSNPFPQGQYNANQKPLYSSSGLHASTTSLRVNPQPNPSTSPQANQGQAQQIPPRINTQISNQPLQNQTPTSNPNASTLQRRTSDRATPNSYIPNPYPQGTGNQMPPMNSNTSNPLHRSTDRMPLPNQTSQPINNQQRPVVPKMPAVNPMLANSLKLPIKNPNLKVPKMPTPIATPEIVEVVKEKCKSSFFIFYAFFIAPD